MPKRTAWVRTSLSGSVRPRVISRQHERHAAAAVCNTPLRVRMDSNSRIARPRPPLALKHSCLHVYCMQCTKSSPCMRQLQLGAQQNGIMRSLRERCTPQELLLELAGGRRRLT